MIYTEKMITLSNVSLDFTGASALKRRNFGFTVVARYGQDGHKNAYWGAPNASKRRENPVDMRVALLKDLKRPCEGVPNLPFGEEAGSEGKR